MYSLIRFIVFFLVFLLLCYWSYSRKFTNRRKLYLLYAAICFAFFAISHFLPIENALYKFPTPNAVFSYTNFEKLSHVIDGKESCMFVYPTGKSTYSVNFAGKHSDGYALLPQYGSRMVFRKNDGHGIITVHHIEGTSDYYIVAAFWGNASVEIYDDSGEIHTDVVNINNSGLFYFYVHNLSENHYILVDGNRVNIYS